MFGFLLFSCFVMFLYAIFYIWYYRCAYFISFAVFFSTFKDKMLYVQSKNFYLKFLWTINKNILDECIRYLFSHWYNIGELCYVCQQICYATLFNLLYTRRKSWKRLNRVFFQYSFVFNRYRKIACFFKLINLNTKFSTTFVSRFNWTYNLLPIIVRWSISQQGKIVFDLLIIWAITSAKYLCLCYIRVNLNNSTKMFRLSRNAVLLWCTYTHTVFFPDSINLLCTSDESELLGVLVSVQYKVWCGKKCTQWNWIHSMH